MVRGSIDVVHSNGIHSKVLHQHNVSLALLSVDQRVLRSKLIGDACQETSSVRVCFTNSKVGSIVPLTFDEELGSILAKELIANNFNRLNGSRKAKQVAKQKVAKSPVHDAFKQARCLEAHVRNSKRAWKSECGVALVENTVVVE